MSILVYKAKGLFFVLDALFFMSSIVSLLKC